MRLRVPFAMIALTVICGLAMAPSAAPANEGRRAAGVMLPEAEETLEPLELPTAPAARHSQRPSASIGRGAPMPNPTMDPAGLARAKRRARWSPDAPVADTLRLVRDVGPKKLSIDASFEGHNATTFTRLATDGVTWSVNLPYPAVAASNTTILHATLYGLLLVDRPGNANRRTANIHDLIGIGLLDADGEPTPWNYRLGFDPASGRFFIVFALTDFTKKQSTIYVFVSRSASPAGFGTDDWCTYTIDSKIQNSYAAGFGMGFDDDFLAVAADTWKFAGGFNNAYFWVIDKVSLVDNAASCPAISSSRFKAKDDDQGHAAFQVQPAADLDGSGPGGLFMLSTQWRSETMSNYIVWRILKRPGGRGPKVKITSMRLTGEAFEHPPNAAHKGGGELNTGQATVSQAAFRDGRLYGVHALSCKQGPAPNESCLRIVEILVDDDLRATTLTRQSTFGVGKNKHAFKAGIAVNADGHIAVPFHYAGSKRFLSVAYTDKGPGAGNASKMAVLKKGNYGAKCGPDGNQVGPWAGAQVDPTDDTSFIVVGEYGNKQKAQDANSNCRWSTRIGILQ